MTRQDHQHLIDRLRALSLGQDAGRLDRIAYRHATQKTDGLYANEVVDAVLYDFNRDKDAPGITADDRAKHRLGLRINHIAGHPGLLARCLASAASGIHRNDAGDDLRKRMFAEWGVAMRRLAAHLNRSGY